MIHLSDLNIGDKAKILGYLSCNTSYRRKLLGLGFVPGTELQIINIAPLGDPIQVLARGLSICLRKHEAHILKLEKMSECAK